MSAPENNNFFHLHLLSENFHYAISCSKRQDTNLGLKSVSRSQGVELCFTTFSIRETMYLQGGSKMLQHAHTTLLGYANYAALLVGRN